jgi:predicted dehydrogenase
MHLTDEDKAVGKENYHTAMEAFDQSERAAKIPAGADGKENRRNFLKTLVGAGIVSGAGLGASYFKYSPVSKPLRVAVIGSGDEGNVLIGAMNPNYVDLVAICEIRPFNVHRSFHGDWESDTALAARPGIIKVFGYPNEDAAKAKVKVYQDYKECLKDPNVEAVIIALPLFLHAQVAVEAMQAGKHVLTEKLMAHNVAQCKVMARVAEKLDMYLAVGHQRHYSVLYDNAVNLIQWGLLGELHHVRAQWHRGNLPGGDSWQKPLPILVDAIEKGERTKVNFVQREFKDLEEQRKKARDAGEISKLERKLAQWAAWLKDEEVNAENYGYKPFHFSDGKTRSALEELIRWRLFQRTGGGLMAELGSHQLDAASIFCSALRRPDEDGKIRKAHPLTVHAVGGRHMFPYDRDAEDHVYCMFEFPGPGYPPDFDVGYYDPEMDYPPRDKGIPSYDDDPTRKIVVTYSSINGNGFGGYGEVVMGTRGTIVLEREQEVLFFKSGNDATSTKVGVKDDKGGPTLDTQASGKGPALAKAAENQGPVSRGYREEIEHFAWCVRNSAPKEALRCRPEVALGDAVIALTTNVAMKKAAEGEGGFVKFDENWYDIHHDATPDGSTISDENDKLKAGLA